MNRAASAFGRFLLKDWDLLVFLVVADLLVFLIVAVGWERVIGVSFTVRTLYEFGRMPVTSPSAVETWNQPESLPG